MKNLKIFFTKSLQECIDFYIQETEEMFEKKKDSSKSSKVQKLEELLSNDVFGCKTENVAKLCSILIDEEVVCNKTNLDVSKKGILLQYDRCVLVGKIMLEKDTIFYIAEENDGEINFNEDYTEIDSDIKKPTKKQIKSFVTKIYKTLNS